MHIDWTTVIASAITAAIVSGTTFISNRYLSRILDRVEKKMAELKEHEVWEKKVWENGEKDKRDRDKDKDKDKEREIKL